MITLCYFFKQIKEFKEAIEGDYFFEMFVDDLPMWGYVGEVCDWYTKKCPSIAKSSNLFQIFISFVFIDIDNIIILFSILYILNFPQVAHEEFLLGKAIQGARVYLYPHLHFIIGFNNDQIVSANVTTDVKRRIDITEANSGQEVSLMSVLCQFYVQRICLW